jgi:ABC-type molybdate transport system substrate-binding protein
MVMAEDVRAALRMVARGEAPLGIVYETDAKIEPAVKVIGIFPDNTPRSDHLSRGVKSKCQTGCGAIFFVLADPNSEVGL